MELALTDPLTGLRNQRYLMRHLGSLLAVGQPTSIVGMIDIDDLKAVNDRWGQSAGDATLCRVADTLRRRTGVFDSLARYGGEAFMVVMSGVSANDAIRAAERLRGAVRTMRFQPKPDTLHPLTVSIGLVRTMDPEITTPELMAAANRALYRAKRLGRNRVEVEMADRQPVT